MAHIRQEVGLGPVGGIGTIAGLDQIGDVGDGAGHAHRPPVIALGDAAGTEPAITAICTDKTELHVIVGAMLDVTTHGGNGLVPIIRVDIVRVVILGEMGGLVRMAQQIAQPR